MGLFQFLGYRNFLKEEEMRDKFFNSEAKFLKIFETQLQITWLIKYEDEIYFVIDDIEKDKGPLKKVSYTLNQFENSKFENHSKNFGVIKVDICKCCGKSEDDWLVSKKLFFNSEKEIKEFIKN